MEANDRTAALQRIKFIMETRRLTQSALCRMLGMERGYFSRVLSGKLPLTDRLVNMLVLDLGISRDWLLRGRGVPYPRPTHMTRTPGPMVMHDAPLQQGDEPFADNGPGPDETGHDAPRGTRAMPVAMVRGNAVYDIDVTAGSDPLDRSLTHDRVIGYVDMPHISPDAVIVRVSGDSMTPTVPSGSYIAVRKVPVRDVIFWGQIYVVVTENYRMVKYLRRHTDPTLVTLHSDNPRYDDIEMPLESIQDLYLVETVINYDRRV